MTTENDTCFVNGIRDSVTSFDNKDKDHLFSGDFPEAIQNHVTKIDKISEVESKVNVAHDEGK